MGYFVFLCCLAMEYCPVEGWDWDFGLMWIIIAFLLIVQLAVDVTKATKGDGDDKAS
jgi:hypothetical protein